MDMRPNPHELAYSIRLITASSGKRRHRWAIVGNDSGEQVEVSPDAYLTMQGAFDAAEPALKAWIENPPDRRAQVR